MSLIIGIDASRNRSGGAIAHIIGILTEFDPQEHDIKEIHIWSFSSLLNQVPDFPWLFKHNPKDLEKSLFRQLIWQAFSFSRELNSVKCDILFNSSAISICRFKPMVALSQTLISYEPGILKHYGISFARLRFLTIHIIQNFTFRRADGVIFLSNYSGNLIQKSCGLLQRVAYVPHGINEEFNIEKPIVDMLKHEEHSIRCIYVSDTSMYKNQWVVVRAISLLRDQGLDINLSLVGGGKGAAQNLLDRTISELQSSESFVEQIDFIPNKLLPALLIEKDIFIFASSCENLPITLIEAMAVGLPIACSDRGPMPEILQDGGIYFDPEDFNSIAKAIKKIIDSQELRGEISTRAKSLSQRFNWSKTSNDTFRFISETFSAHNEN